jgi:2,4-dienoyl-CoA reductase-like NADH-dependent reductase (Old Yellow Enzyme family)
MAGSRHRAGRARHWPEASPDMSAPALFSPLALGPVTLANRIAVAPMCQYSAADGCAGDWHLQHLPSLAMSGAGLVMVEATGVERRGRITHGCLGLYSDDCEAALARALAVARRVAGPAKFGIQLAHAGRKASAQLPWEGGQALHADQDPWPTVSASALAFDAGWHVPEALDEDGMDRVTDAFVLAARRAVRLGFEVIELHSAHGYLLHQFLSPLSNRRDDDCGGSLENRMRFPLQVLEAVRAVVPAGTVLGMRISATDWVDGGWSVDDSIEYVREARAVGLDYVCVSSAGNTAQARVPVGPGYQVPAAARIRAETGVVTRAVGLITSARQAGAIIENGAADQVALARAFLDDPRWGWHAADALGAEVHCPPQYARARLESWRTVRDAAD